MRIYEIEDKENGYKQLVVLRFVRSVRLDKPSYTNCGTLASSDKLTRSDDWRLITIVYDSLSGKDANLRVWLPTKDAQRVYDELKVLLSHVIN